MLIRAQIKEDAKSAFKQAYWPSVGAPLIVLLVFAGAAALCILPLLGLAAYILLLPVGIGLLGFFLRIYRRESDTGIGRVFSDAFEPGYTRKLGGMLWITLWVYLWTLLFVIPGIIKCYAYSMAPFILADCPLVTARGALKLSMRMTKGHKAEIFIMQMSFIGWWMLGVLTFGILDVFWVIPYCGISFAGLYDELKHNAIENGAVAAAEFEGETAAL